MRNKDIFSSKLKGLNRPQLRRKKNMVTNPLSFNRDSWIWFFAFYREFHDQMLEPHLL